jgi:diguanylate cyclase (GGDEF)-like protein
MTRPASGPSPALLADLARAHRLAATRGQERAVGRAFLALLRRHAGLPFACLLLQEEARGAAVLLGGDLAKASPTRRLRDLLARPLVALLPSTRRRRWSADLLPASLRDASGGGGIAVPLGGAPGSRARLLVRDRDLPLLERPAARAVLAHLAAALANVDAYRRALDLSFRDELTGVYNYRFLMEALDREAKRAQRFTHVFSVAMLDLDNLKEFNDRHGHLRGSEVLRAVGRILPACIRKVDLAAKYGGDEFAVILPRANKEDALKVCERIRRRIASRLGRGPKGARITVSLGVATFPDDGRTPRVLLRRADRALYRAKAKGRNSVSI